MASDEVECQLIGLVSSTTATAFKNDIAQVFIHLYPALKLSDLERNMIAGGITKSAKKDLRVLDIASVEQHMHQIAEFLLKNMRDVAHRAGLVKKYADSIGTRMRLAVAALAKLDAIGIERGVNGPCATGSGSAAISETACASRSAHTRRFFISIG